MSARVWSDDPVRLAKRRGVLGMVIVGLLVALGAGTAALWGASAVIAITGVAALAQALLLLIVSATAFGIARQHPSLAHLGGANDLAAVLALVVGVIAAVLGVLAVVGEAGAALSAIGLLIPVAIMTTAVTTMATANRRAIRAVSSAAGSPINE